MKKKLLFVVVTVLALISCSSDETVAVKQDSPISFRSLTNNVTRAADINGAGDLASFNVFAKLNGGDDYIGTSTGTPSPVEFTLTTGSTYTSASKYYWPASGNLDFYAWSTNSSANGDKKTNITQTSYAEYVVTVPFTAADQPDFIYASKYNQSQVASVPLTFNHYESRIVLKVKNTANNLDFEVTGWKIVYPDNTGTITFSDFNTTLAAVWTNNTTLNKDNEFVSAFTAITKGANTTAAQLGTNVQQMIMIPQTIVPASTDPGYPGTLAYVGSATTDKLNRPYIAIEYKADFTGTSTNKAAKGWRCWPLPDEATWEKGKQYTYVIDLADGGYKEFADGTDTTPDPEFEGSLIQFAIPTVVDWITDLDGDAGTNDDINLQGT